MLVFKIPDGQNPAPNRPAGDFPRKSYRLKAIFNFNRRRGLQAGAFPTRCRSVVCSPISATDPFSRNLHPIPATLRPTTFLPVTLLPATFLPTPLLPTTFRSTASQPTTHPINHIPTSAPASFSADLHPNSRPSPPSHLFQALKPAISHHLLENLPSPPPILFPKPPFPRPDHSARSSISAPSSAPP